ncbi:MAG: rhomboid family intramembrane serine protease [Waddliaceae bacterium]|jgi:membrane associated rhomboid family serine protease|nr:rhomboid family intramembrane serine protease [Waddliaceae bacterium]
MTYQRSYHLEGAAFPSILKKLIIFTVAISVISAFLDPIIVYYFPVFAPQRLLSLSLWGLDRYMLWQPLSYMLIHPASYGISLGFIIHLLFNMLILGFVGARVLERIGARSFLVLYFSSGVIAAIIAWGVMALTGSSIFLAGCTPSIYAVLIMWMLIFPEAEILLFFIIPIKVKWLITGLLGVYLLISVSQMQFVTLASVAVGIIVGYVYGIVAFDFRSPFLRFRNFETSLHRNGKKTANIIRRMLPSFPRKGKKGTIVDFSTGEEIDKDEVFMDAMLEKISKDGEGSLSRRERKRMKKISERR